MSASFHKKTVYSIGFVADQVVSVGGDCVCYNHGTVASGLTKPIELPQLESGRYSALGTGSDEKTGSNLCAIGHETGKIELFEILENKKWNLIDSKSDLHLKYITDIKFRSRVVYIA